MIKFFSIIRQNLISENKTGKYLKYAIGEIILVVIGILIAIQINSFYNSQANVKENKRLLSRMIEEINLNIERVDFLEYSEEFVGGRKHYPNSLAEKRQDSIITLFNLGLNEERIQYILDKPIVNFSSHNMYSTVFEEMQNTGKLYKIGSKTLITEIAKYYNFVEAQDVYHTKSVDQVMQDWRECKYGWHSFENDYALNPEEAIKKNTWLKNKDSKNYRDIHMYVMKGNSVTKINRKRLQDIKKKSLNLIELIKSEL